MNNNPEDAISNPPPSETPKHKFTPIDRIKELNAIDASTASLLQSFSHAIQVLGSDSPSNLTTAKTQFIDSVTTFFTTLSSIDVRLRRQVYALQEAELISEGDVTDTKRGASAAGSRDAVVATGASGLLDGSWLNSQGDQVERGMEKELYAKAREFLEKLERFETGWVVDVQELGGDPMVGVEEIQDPPAGQNHG